MYSLPQRNPVAPTRKRLSAFGSNSRVNLQTPGAPARLQTADRETRGSAVRRPRTGLTCSPPTTLATGPRFGFRNSSSAGRYGIVPPKTPQPESSGRCFESAGKVQPARSNTRGSTPDDHLSGLARRAQLWKPVIKPTTSSASCRPRLGLTAGSVLPTSRNRGESNLAGRLRTKLRAEAPGPLKLSTAGFCIPHPGKNGVGEDAHFYSEHAVGVADGVGGWAAHGIDAGEYARQLMKRCEESIESGNTDPVAAMWHGYKAVQSLGSSTCFVMVLDPATRVVQCANLGDSGYRHVRGSVVLSKAEVGQHYFNCPFQLGSHSGDDPDDALKQSITVNAGDKIVCGSDGLFDNLFDDEIVSGLEAHPNDCCAAARAICRLAKEAAANPRRQGPFAQEANASGLAFQGGKLDDITCTVSVVVTG